MNSAAAITAAPASEFDVRTPEFTDEDFEDLSDLLYIAKFAERRLETIFADEENRALNHLPRFNEGVQALWRLVAIRKALIRLNRESKNPRAESPVPSAASENDDPSSFGVQASACPDFPSSSEPSAFSAPSAVKNISSSTPNPVYSEPSVPPSSSALKNSSSYSTAPSTAASPNPEIRNPRSEINSTPPSPFVSTPRLPSVNAVPDIPAAKIGDIKKINATLDKLQAALDRRRIRGQDTYCSCFRSACHAWVSGF